MVNYIIKNNSLGGKRHGERLGYCYDGKLHYKEYYINGDEVSEEEWIEYGKPKYETQFLTDLYV